MSYNFSDDFISNNKDICEGVVEVIRRRCPVAYSHTVEYTFKYEDGSEKYYYVVHSDRAICSESEQVAKDMKNPENNTTRRTYW